MEEDLNNYKNEGFNLRKKNKIKYNKKIIAWRKKQVTSTKPHVKNQEIKKKKNTN